MAKKSSSGGHTGSPRHTATIGPGPVAGAGELNTTPHSKPGRAASKKGGADPTQAPMRKTPSAPKGMKIEREGE